MIVLQPVETEQTISIFPRFTDNTAKYVILRKDGEGTSENIDYVTVSEMSYYVDLSFASTILDEGETYSIEIYSLDIAKSFNERVVLDMGIIEPSSCPYTVLKEYGLTIWYRDKIYVTSQNDYTIKHKLAQPSYTEYSDADDNTYIIG